MTAEAANARLAELLAVEPDLHALMLATVRAWVERYAPGKSMSLIGTGMPGEPCLSLPITPLAVAASAVTSIPAPDHLLS